MAVCITLGTAAGPALAMTAMGEEGAAVSAFLGANPQVTAIRRQVEVARAEAVAAGVLPNPTLDLGREQVFLTGGPAEENRLALRAPLILGGKRELRGVIAQAGIQAAEGHANQQIQELVAAFRAAFAQAHQHDTVGQAIGEGLAAYRRLERVAEVRRQSGESAGYDVLRLRLARAALEARQADAEARAGEARARLVGLLGQPLDGPLQPAPLGALPGAEELVILALARRGDLLALRAEVEQARAAVELAERTRWPDPEVALGLKQTNEPTVQGVGYTAGVAWPLPLFDRAQGARARAQAELNRVEAEAAALEARLKVEVPAARASVMTRVGAVVRFEREVLTRVPAVVRVAEVAYREGDQGIVPLLDAHQAALDARLQSLELSAAARTARLDLERLTGGPFPDASRSHP